MKGIHLIFIFSIISQPLLFSQVIVKRNNQVSKELANVNWSKEYTLFDYTTDEPIFPLIRNGQPVYKIYYASKEDPRPNYGEFNIVQVEGLKYYKFKNRETCFKFCLTNKLNAVPTLTTSSISGITSTSATSGGNITTDGGASITARGIVWSTSTNPTITLSTKTSNGTGTGSFSSTLTNLTPKTTYYVRAYATNSTGTGYGNEITFTTSDSTIVMGIPCPGTPTVKDIDGNTYNTVQIGTQCWTKENLRVSKYRDGFIIPLDESGGTTGNVTGQTWSSRTTGARTVYGHSAGNLATYGYLYNWYAVADSKGLCPSGWHVPSDGEWNSLSSYLGNDPGIKLADTSWILAFGKPTNESGFSVKPGGYRDTTGRFSTPLISGNFWSTTKFTSNLFWGRELYSKGNWDTDSYYGASGLSVRCLKDTLSIVSIPSLSTTEISSITTTSAISGGNIISDGGASITSRGVVWATTPNPTIALSTKTSNGTGTGSFSSSLTNLTPKTTYYVRAYATNSAGTGYGNEISFTTSDSTSVMGIPCTGTPTVKDTDGNTYNTVQIGTQCWTKENLRVTKYRDGSVIPLDGSGGSTGNGTGQTWSSRTTGARTVYGHSATNLATYGYLYNWYAVADTKGLCPSGWHVPSDSEWTTLTTYLGGESVAGGKMKSTGTTLWSSPNTEATNESGFSVLPGGYRVIDASFNNIRFNAFFWSATLNFNKPENRFLSFNFGFVNRYYSHNESVGASVRCLMDTSAIVSITTITTTAITSITTTSATSGGNITADGGASITGRGVVWSTSTNPTIALSTKTSNGTGTGSFTSTLTNLTPKTTYYVRAYASNSAGTGYGNEITFTTTDSSSVMGIPCPGTPTVKDVDGNTYNTVQIGTQCWTKENLRVTKYRDGSIIPLDESGGTNGDGTGQTWSSRTTGARTVYGHSAANLATYGYLYNWYAVADTKGLCPSGWHVPSDSEWTILTNYLGGESVAGGKMKSTGTTIWNSPNTGATNESGFSALPGGVRNNYGSFISIKNYAYFWSVAENDYFFGWYRFLYFNDGNVYKSLNSKKGGFSVRCLKDTSSIVSIPTLTTTAITAITTTSATSGGNITSEGGASITARGIVWSTSTNPTITLSTKTSNGTGTGSFSSTLTNLTPKTTYYVRSYATNSAGTGYGNEISFTTSDSTIVMGIPCSGTPTVKDIDGNTYNTVQIGTQCWTKENLTVTKYRDGTVIPLDESGGTNGDGTGETWSSRTTGARTVYGHNATNLSTYGYLYNWYSVADTKGLCPGGWHVPSDSEWTILTNYLGGESVAGGKMKSTGTTIWNSPNTGATNESGFSALPGGVRNNFGSFISIKNYAYFWSVAENDYFFGWYRFLYFNDGNVYKSLNSKKGGFSVRCIKDTNSIVSIPTLTTTVITAITATSSSSGGNITADGGASITARGLVWSTSSNPTIALTTKTSNGTGTGSFSSSLTNLTPKTSYYVRAYATNSAGTAYGNEITFTTLDSPNVMGIPCPGTPTVKDIDGNTYNTVQIGAQCWTKENLRVTKYRDGSVIPLDESGGTAGNGTGQTWSSRTTGARTVYGHSAANLATYGYLYNWYAVADTKGLCPSGWHVPTDVEWTNLTNYLSGESTAGGKMKTTGITNWNSPNTGATNESGFSALPGGFRNSDSGFGNIRNYAFFWSSNEGDLYNALYRYMDGNNGIVLRSNASKQHGFSVRCLKDTNVIVSAPSLTTTAITAITTTSSISGGNITADGGLTISARGVVWSTSTNLTISLSTKTSDGTGTGSFSSTLTNLTPKTTYYVRAYATNSAGTAYGNEISFTTAEAVMNIPCPGLPTVEDIDGNIYNTVKIGTQCWMKENLRVTKYKDGTPIPMVNDRDNWLSLNNGAWCWYNNDSISFNINHGKLYNWYAAANKLGICPNGWHLGTLNDWNNLINFLEGEKLATIKLKENSGIWWNDNFTFYEDLSGFSALPSGQRTSENFYGITYRASFMLPEEIDNRLSRKITLRSIFEVYRDTWGKEHGASIRCIKDTLPINVNSVPKLTTLTLYSDTTLSIGNGGGKILSDGGAQIIQKGIVWSETKNPTIDLPTKTMDGIGSSNFTSKILNLVPKTKYYVRAYAINREGVGYGDEILFLNDYTSTIGLPCLNYPTVQDIDGNVYNTVQIGTQCWMKENLRVTKYNYGIEIPLDTSGGYWGNEPRQTWTNRKTGARTFFNNDLNNLNKFGYLYNAYVTNSNGGNICPIGWHVPSDGDWSILTRFLGGEEFAGNKLKIYGSGTNESGFSGLAGGFRESSGNYRLLDAYSYFLSSSKHDWTSPQSSNRIIYAYGSFVFRLADKSDGLSIRCIKD